MPFEILCFRKIGLDSFSLNKIILNQLVFKKQNAKEIND